MTFKHLVKISFVLAVLLITVVIAAFKSNDRPRVLVFSKTKGWKHSSIQAGINAIKTMGGDQHFIVDTTTNGNLFTDENLKKYSAVIFNNTTGNALNGVQQTAFERYIQAGGGFVGIHAAADTEYDWAWYGNLVGAYFDSHPHQPNVRKATIHIADQKHPSTYGLPNSWERSDEWYNYKSIYPKINVLVTLDESTYEGGTNGSGHPIAWYHDYDGGRSFYTGGGHTEESFSEPLFLKHLAGGIKYAIGEGLKLDYGKSYAKVMPEQNRFVKTVLLGNLDSPMELVAANDGRVFFTELFGKITVFDTKTKQHSLIATLPVTNTGGTGLIGIALDPNFEINQFVYLYYTPAGQNDEPIKFRLSRFLINKSGKLDLTSEKKMLEVPVQKNSGSHHGGSLAFDRAGNLYLSTGDSTTPFASDGYAPLDERPDKTYYSQDSQRGASNTNDLKGKILRIHPEPDGTYTIPAGNLFPKGTAKTKPEIYIMGVRNPYRIAINPISNLLYWGDIGPDAGVSTERGPMGYDELNQARQAGNFGWPYFAGNNQPYAKWDFQNKSAGPLFNPLDPINSSPNNTGLNHLPPAMPAMIWYPYAASDKFPELGSGARCIIAGTFYTYDKHSGAANKFPEYYDNALFMADWMRNWVFAVRFNEKEDFVRNEPFMSANGDFRRPVDMTFSKDGVMYMLEYGSVYGMANADARLVSIHYNYGNRAPKAFASVVDTVAVTALDKRVFLTSERKDYPIQKAISGPLPLRVKFSSEGSNDPDDDDELHYEWYFDGVQLGSKLPNPTYTYTKPGLYKAILKIKDSQGLVSEDTVTVRAGNSVPQVQITSADNTTFLWKNKAFKYHVKIADKEDGIIDPKRVKIFYVYNSDPANLEASIRGQTVSKIYAGKALIAASDCKACHQLSANAVGPSFIAIANRYKIKTGAIELLSKKIINGGAGSWGKTSVMSAHPQVSINEAKEMVKYIFSLTDKKEKAVLTTIPRSGALNLITNGKEPQGAYTIMASYTDKGGKVIGPLTGIDQISLRDSRVHAVFADAHPGFPRFRNSLSEGGNKAYLLFRDVDLNGIKRLKFSYSSKDKEGEIQIRMDSQAGPVIGRTDFKPTGSFEKFIDLTATLSQKVQGKHHLYIVFVKNTLPNDALIKINTISFEQ